MLAARRFLEVFFLDWFTFNVVESVAKIYYVLALVGSVALRVLRGFQLVDHLFITLFWQRASLKMVICIRNG